MTRFCPNCGTEVDETAVFCPTCGQPVDQAMESEMPAAPAWPEPSRQPAQERPEAAPPPEVVAPPPPAAPPPQPATSSPPPPAASQPPGEPPPAAASTASGMPIEVTTPLTMSGWLIGIGAAIAALGALVSLFDGVRTVVDLIVLVAMAGVAVSVFFSSSLPAFGHTRLATLAIVLVALGAATDRLLGGVGGAGELLLFLGAAAAVIGAVLLEVGRDQPMGIAR